MKLTELLLRFKRDAVYQLLIKLADVYIKAYLKVIWTSPANIAVSFELPTDILKELYKPKAPILIKVNDEVYIQSNLVAIVKNHLVLNLEHVLPAPDELKTEHFKALPSYKKPVMADICIDGNCVQGSLSYIDDSSLYVSLHDEKITEFYQKLISKSITIKDLLNKELDVFINLPDKSRFRGNGAVIAISVYDSRRLDLRLGNLRSEENLELLKAYLTQKRSELVQMLAKL